MAVPVAVETVADKWDSAQIIHDGSDANLKEFGLMAMAMGDVCRSDGGRVDWWPEGSVRAWLRGGVSTVENEMRGVEMEALSR
jgi:hypothetical protein